MSPPPSSTFRTPRVRKPTIPPKPIPTHAPLFLSDHTLYGTARLGQRQQNKIVNQSYVPPGTHNLVGVTYVQRGWKAYELSNHLGNVLSVISDRKEAGHCNDTLVAFYYPDIIQNNDYYPFGSPMEGRGQQSKIYRWGFNGMEKDNEIYGPGNSYTAEFWQYDPRIGRRWNVDPYDFLAPDWTPYRAFFNNPIFWSDPEGLFETRKEAREYRNENKLEGYRVRLNQDGNYSLDNKKEGISFFNDPEYGIQKAVLISAKRPDAKTLTPWELGTEWLTGTGPKSRDFTDGDYITELYRAHEHFEASKQNVRRQLQNSNGLNTNDVESPYNLEGIEGVGKYLRDYSTLLTGGSTGNILFTYLGSHSNWAYINSVDIENRTAQVTFVIHNTSTLSSATRPPLIGYLPIYQNTIGKLIDRIAGTKGVVSETEQVITLTETINW